MANNFPISYRQQAKKEVSADISADWMIFKTGMAALATTDGGGVTRIWWRGDNDEGGRRRGCGGVEDELRGGARSTRSRRRDLDEDGGEIEVKTQ